MASKYRKREKQYVMIASQNPQACALSLPLAHSTKIVTEEVFRLQVVAMSILGVFVHYFLLTASISNPSLES